MTEWEPGAALAAYHAGVMIICELGAQFTDETWTAPTPCPEWRAIDLVSHLRCVADDYHTYLDDAPAGLLTRLMSSGADAGSLARKLARRNAAAMAALPEASGAEHVAAFAASARSYALRAVRAWDSPHHRYRDTVVTVGAFVGAACAEWHLHAWDLAQSLGMDYRPADGDVLAAGWRAGMPHLPLALPQAMAPCGAGVGQGAGAPARGAMARGDCAGMADGDVWRALLTGSGRAWRPHT